MPLEIQGQNVIIAPGTKQVTKQEVIDAITAINPNVDVSTLNIPELVDNPTVEQIAEWTAVANANASNYLEKLDFVSTQFSTIPAADAKTKEDVIAQLKQQYPAEAYSGKTGDWNYYSTANPQLKALEQFMNDGGMDMLAANFSRNDAAEIISAVFDCGIKLNDKGQIEIPQGHDIQGTGDWEAARKIYRQFNDELFSDKFNSSPEIKALENQLNQLTNNYNTNVGLLKSMQAKIEQYEAKAEDLAAAAKKEAENIKNAYETKAQQKNTELENLKNDYKNGKISYEVFEASRQALSLPDPDMSSAENLMAQADVQLANIKGCQQQITLLNTQNEALKVQIDDVNAEIAIEKTKVEQSDPKRTDPIGFTTADGARVDFMLDIDGNNDLSNEQEFLGAQNGFADMAALNTNGDDVVDIEELSKAGVKVVVQDADGQRVMDAKDYFTNGIQIDTKNYQELAKELDNGNLLAGQTTANIGGQKVNVTSTFDTLEYLDSNYQFSDADEGKGRFAQGAVKGLLEDPNIKAEDFDGLYEKAAKAIETADTAISQIVKDMKSIKTDFEQAKSAAYQWGLDVKAEKEEEARKARKAEEAEETQKTDKPKTDEKPQYASLPPELKPGAMGIKLKGVTYAAKKQEILNLISKVKTGNYSPADTAKTLQLLREAARANGTEKDSNRETKYNNDFINNENAIKEAVEESNNTYKQNGETTGIVFKPQDDLYIYDKDNKIKEEEDLLNQD